MSLSTNSIAQIRAWLYSLLADLEERANIEGERTESHDKITIEIKFNV